MPATFFFGKADAGHLGVGKDDLSFQALIKMFGWILTMNGVPSGDLSLFDGDMDNFMKAVDISHCEDMWLRGSHRVIHYDASLFGLDVSRS